MAKVTLPWISKKRSVVDIEMKPQIKRRKHEPEEYDGIPTDLIAFEILTRLPVKSLLKCKSVCKSWRSLISDPTFTAAHLKRSRENPQLVISALTHKPKPRRGFAMYTYQEGRNKSRFLFAKEFPEVQKYLFPPQHCNGLLLLNTQTQMFVCNPGTKEFVELPAGDRDNYTWIKDAINYTAGFGYVESTNTYKIAQYFYRSRNLAEKTYDLGFEVLTLGTAELTWRGIAEDPPYPIGDGRCPIAVGEVIYFIINNRLHRDSPKAFLCFNLSDEKFRVVDPPCQHPIDRDNMNIVDFDGNPCFIHLSQGKMKFEMWISKDFIGHAWVPSFSFNLLQPAKLVLPVAFRRGKLLLKVKVHDEVHKLEYYDPQSKVFDPVICIAKDLNFYNEQNCGLHVFAERAGFIVVNYAESLVSIRPKS